MKMTEIVKKDNGPAIEKFVQWVCDKLMIGTMPIITYSNDKEDDQHYTGHYDTETNRMWIYTGNRNLIDILRTVAHELSHHKQNLDGDLSDGADIVNSETQADMAAGMMIKIWVRKHPEIIQ